MRIALAIVLGLAIGTAGGWLLAPRDRPPHVGREALLRQRATLYYAASRRLDKLTMSQMFTPAHQLADTEKLKKANAQSKAILDRQPADAKQESMQTAANIKREDIEVQIEGDWAVTTGKYDLYAFGKKIPSRLDQVVWVFSHGNWWQYNFTPAERNSYGLPPDFAMKLDPIDAPRH